MYKENLTLNENDNQGIRYLLLETLLASNDYKQARQLLNKYSDDYSIEFKFGSVVLGILENKIEQADKTLIEAVKINKFFVDEVTKSKHIQPPPLKFPIEPNFDAGISVGSIQQAYDYWTRNKELYNNGSVIF